MADVPRHRVTLNPAIRAILNRTRLARIALDAQLGIIPSGVVKFMADNDDLLGAGLGDGDLEFLRNADGLKAPFNKIRLAKQLIAEARAEIRAVLGEATAKSTKKVSSKKKTKTVDIKFDADKNALDHDLQLVLGALDKEGVFGPVVAERAKLPFAAVKKLLKQLRARKLAKTAGAGRGMTWAKV